MAMKLKEVMKELKSMGNAQTCKTLKRHGAPDDLYGVKVGDLKKIVKKIKMDQDLAEELFATGNGDAMYLAGLIADASSVKKSVLKKWVKSTDWIYITEYTVAGVAADSKHGWDLGLEWIEAKKESVACSGWATLGGVIATREDEELDHKKIKALLKRIEKEIHSERNRVRYVMNGFVIAVGTYIPSMSKEARKLGVKIGKIEIDMGDTSCKVPYSPEYIDKVVKMGRLGKKRKTAKC